MISQTEFRNAHTSEPWSAPRRAFVSLVARMGFKPRWGLTLTNGEGVTTIVSKYWFQHEAVWSKRQLSRTPDEVIRVVRI